MINFLFVCFIVVVSLALGYVSGWYFTGHKYCTQIESWKKVAEKYLTWVRLYDIWMINDAEGKTVEQYLKANEIENVAIYGMSYLGIRLCRRLKQSGIVNVEYALDCNPQMRLPEIETYYPGNETRSVDTVIVTALYSFDAINDLLLQNGYKNVYALDEILYILFKN